MGKKRGGGSKQRTLRCRKGTRYERDRRDTTLAVTLRVAHVAEKLSQKHKCTTSAHKLKTHI